MTRTNQTLRAWISRESPRENFLSHVSVKCTTRDKSKLHTLRTPTRLRKAALEFNRIHTLRILCGKDSSPTTLSIQTELQL